METIQEISPIRRSARLMAKDNNLSKQSYINHIYMLQNVTVDLLPMVYDLNTETLREIITNYENIIGGLLTDNMLNVQRI